jgi:hypothetical protein
MDSLLDFDEDILRPPWGPYGRNLTLGVVSGFSKLLLKVLNTTIVKDLDRLHQLVMHRDPGVGLLSFCNHTRWAAAQEGGRGTSSSGWMEQAAAGSSSASPDTMAVAAAASSGSKQCQERWQQLAGLQ